MSEPYRQEIEWGGSKLILESGKIARQADGAVMVTHGETMVLCTVVADKSTSAPNHGFVPLTVNYQEKFFAARKIPGGFFKREGRPSEQEILTCRLIDRSFRPLFVKNFRSEVQLVCTVFSYDLEHQPDMAALIGASAALTISGIPFLGPVGAARIGRHQGQWLLNPSPGQQKDSELDLAIAGTREGALMVEAEAHELSEELVLEAIVFGHQQLQPVIEAIVELAGACAKPPWEVIAPSYSPEDLLAGLRRDFGEPLRAACAEPGKQARQEKINAIKTAARERYVTQKCSAEDVGNVIRQLEREAVRNVILQSGRRFDGRDPHRIRPIEVEVGTLGRTHGSATFRRGETQALVVTTLGTSQDEQVVDTIHQEGRQSFMLHYNFPPYSTGEIGRMGGPGRREIGHGKLAFRAIRPLLSRIGQFPYTIRVVSEITESNGSSSMATVCGASLALMDAGVPIPRAVAGIAMGLIQEGGQSVVLSDILGAEDHLGDMDFKVAGSELGITALQMDVKVPSLSRELLREALVQARQGRLHVLKEMAKALSSARRELKPTVPQVLTITIPKDRIRELIGPGGKVIRELSEQTGSKIDVGTDGNVKIAASDSESARKTASRIRSLLAAPEVGEIYTGKVVKVLDFGAFVNFLGMRDGLVHISELVPWRVGAVSEVVNVGDEVRVKVLDIDERGRIKLSMRQVDQESGEDLRHSR